MGREEKKKNNQRTIFIYLFTRKITCILRSFIFFFLCKEYFSRCYRFKAIFFFITVVEWAYHCVNALFRMRLVIVLHVLFELFVPSFCSLSCKSSSFASQTLQFIQFFLFSINVPLSVVHE